MNNLDDILDLKIDSPDFPADLTIRGYLELLLLTLWEEGEGFSGKRPFGNSDWGYDLYTPLVKAKCIPGELDEDGIIMDVNRKAGYETIKKLIKRVFEVSKAPRNA